MPVNPVKNKTESRRSEFFVYIILIVTLVMIAPLIWTFAENHSLGAPLLHAHGEGERHHERIPQRSRRYTVTQTQVPAYLLRDTRHGALNLLVAKVTDSGSVIMFVEAPRQYSERFGHAIMIAVWDNRRDYDNYSDYDDYDEQLRFFPRYLRSGLLESFANGDYVFKDYGGGVIFVSNGQTAFLFDYERMVIEHFMLPQHLDIYQAALSNNKTMLAIAAREGFFVDDVTLPGEPLKELITSSSPGGVLITARHPVWSQNDEYIFYKTFADEHIRNAGVTTILPGGNQQLLSLDSTNFTFLRDDSNRIFYYFSSGSTPYQENMFRCGFFDPFGDRRMVDAMRSQVHFFDVAVSPRGTHLAALSYNGNMIRVIIIDIRTKHQIFSALYDDVYDFSFSPDERNFIIRARSDGAEVLSVINIDWEEE